MGEYDRTYKDCEKPSAGGVGTLRAVAGVVLLVAGVGATLWVLSTVVMLITSSGTPGLVKSITPAAEAVIQQAGEQRVTIPREMFGVVGYGMVCFLCLVAAGIAGGLLKGGVALLGAAKHASGDKAEKYYPK